VIVSITNGRSVLHALRLGLGLLVVLTYAAFFRSVWSIWWRDPEFSYGMLIPPIVAYLVWARRCQGSPTAKTASSPAVLLVMVGCALQVVASFSNTLVLSGMALAITLMGSVGFLRGREYLGIMAPPISLLILMVPLPSYLAGDLAWRLQVAASAISSVILEFLGVPVYHDGNLLVLSNFILEVKQACSGSRSLFALIALALVIGLSVERKWWIRILLVAAAPVLSIGANIVRIVGTGLIAHQWGSLAANESLHSAWGILVFVIAVSGLLVFRRLLQWVSNAYA
jgi:exosortase